MNKNDLIAAVAGNSGLSKADAAKAVDGMVDAITTAGVWLSVVGALFLALAPGVAMTPRAAITVSRSRPAAAARQTSSVRRVSHAGLCRAHSSDARVAQEQLGQTGSI